MVLRGEAPDTSQLTISGMMAWLFRDELTQTGKPPVISDAVERLLAEHQQASMPGTAVRASPEATRKTLPEVRAVEVRSPTRTFKVAGAVTLGLVALGLSRFLNPEAEFRPPEATPLEAQRVDPQPPRPILAPQAELPTVVEPEQPTPPLVPEKAIDRPVDPTLSKEAAALVEKAVTAMRQGNTMQAKKLAQACVAASPKAYECSKILGEFHARELKTAVAIGWYEKFLDHAPENHPDRIRVLRKVVRYKLESVRPK